MKTKFSGILTLLLAFVVQVSFAQTTVSGTVSEENGPLPGASVLIKGTQTGSQTDFDGNYTIRASPSDILVFSYVGYTSKEITVGVQNTINITLTPADNILEEIIVTAQGVKREEKSLGYAISTVDSERLEAQPVSDIGSILRGEVAGLNITTGNGLSGSASNINIRGFTSLTGSNQPLFVIDGVPFNTDVIADPTAGAANNLNQISGFADIDPNNIASVNVLKGLRASILYGQLGRNGVILITTKTGSQSGNFEKKKTEITVTQSSFISQAILPKYQNEFGGGFGLFFGNFVSNHGPSFTSNRDEDFGTEFVSRNGNTVTINNPLTNVADTSLLGGLVVDPVEFAPATSVEDFFRSGYVSNTSISAQGGNETANFSASYSNLDDRGFTPGNTFRRNNASVAGSVKLSNDFTVSGSFNYVDTTSAAPPLAAANGGNVGSTGNGSSIFSDLIFTPRHIDLFALPFQALDGRSVYYRAGNDIQNPRWTAANARVTSDSRRSFGNITLGYEINDHWSVSNRASLDLTTSFVSNGQNRGGVSGNVLGFLNNSQTRRTTFDDNLTLNGYYNVTDTSNISFTVGGNVRSDETTIAFQNSTQQLVFGTLRGFNFLNQISNEFTSTRNILGLYVDATYDFNEYLFISGSLRNDWASTLESQNNSLLYSGISGSFIPTAAFEGLKGDVLSYLKLRASYGESAGFPDVFSTRNVLNLNPRAFAAPLQDGVIAATNTISNTIANPDILPERISEIEVGLDSRLFNNRLGLNISVYQRATTDLITNQALDPATGFTTTPINAGELEVEGIEIEIDATPLRIGDFTWNINGNFNADETTVLSLPDGVDQIQIGVAGSGAANFAIAGEAYGVIQGFAIQRDANNNPIINPADGTFLNDADLSIIGDPNPDWTSTLVNSFSYKGFNLSFEWQYRHGGDFLSTTASTLLARGNIDLGVDRRANFIIPGVLPNGQPNNIVLTSSDLFFNANLNTENRIYDGSTIRLNEASISYSFPSKLLEKTPFGKLSLRASGNNLWFRAVNLPADANFDTNALSTGVGNGQGIELLTGPTSRRYGFTVTASF